MRGIIPAILSAVLICAARPGLAQDKLGRPPHPFGFEMGMTKAQVIAVVGKDAVKDEEGDAMVLSTAPTPYSDIDEYILMLSPKQGLLKVVGFTKKIETDQEGDQLKDEFNKIVAAVTNKYGTPQMLDFIRNQDESGAEYWMMSLNDKERTLEANWNYGDHGHGGDTQTGVYVEAQAPGINSGQVVIGYEFPGWNSYVKSRSKKQNSVF